MENNSYTVGDVLEVSVFKPKTGKFPIGKANSGIVCKLDLSDKIKFVRYGDLIKAQILEVREKSLLVRPISFIFKTPKSTEEESRVDKFYRKYKKKKM